LGLGVVFGFGSGFASLAWHARHGGWERGGGCHGRHGDWAGEGPRSTAAPSGTPPQTVVVQPAAAPAPAPQVFIIMPGASPQAVPQVATAAAVTATPAPATAP
jgi:hypothetical protein